LSEQFFSDHRVKASALQLRNSSIGDEVVTFHNALVRSGKDKFVQDGDHKNGADKRAH
jgi:hypothetical protein